MSENVSCNYSNALSARSLPKSQLVDNWLKGVPLSQDSADMTQSQQPATTVSKQSTSSQSVYEWRRNLKRHNIEIVKCESIPDEIHQTAKSLKRVLRQTSRMNSHVEDMIIAFAPEQEVSQYVQNALLPREEGIIRCTRGLEMNPDSFFSMRISRFSTSRFTAPRPDFLYGYSANTFDDNYRQIVLDRPSLSSTSQDVLLPFLVIEVKSEGGSMYTGDTQAMGAAAVSLAMAAEIMEEAELPFQNITFFAVVDTSHARVFVAWRQGEITRAAIFVHYSIVMTGAEKAFKGTLQNISEWGTGRRHQEIVMALQKIKGKIEMENDGRSEATDPARQGVRKRGTTSLVGEAGGSKRRKR